MVSVLQKYAPHEMDEFIFTVEKGTNAKKVSELMDIPETLKYNMFINERYCNPETVLQTGDKITFFPLMDGG
mgnify:FL=1